ncbi:hypothetical protein GR140_31995 (plasmid) [Pseudomonas putida]|uniref:hypothetical protein n=1 Tax=Pseudomonas putida TaxID=303 RepID=UPI001BB0925F|nr:hypothetical protein [Pseudomonas putida]QUG93363.1 hypothetical protein GR140_31995 [Pseudomonas putida]
MTTRRKGGRHPLSVSATELAKLGSCEVMVALDLADAADASMRESARKGEQAHQQFHVRAVLNAGDTTLIARG